MAAVGQASLVVALLTALYAGAAALYGARVGDHRFVVSARRAVYCLATLLLLAFALIEAAYLRSDLSFALVAQNSSTDTPTFYKLTAMWSSQAGSLLLWVLLLALFASAALYLTRRGHRDTAAYATAVLAGVAAFFLALMVFLENPFETLARPPAEGAGLNPLLRNPMMMFHPPMLYGGYVGFSIPFAFAVGALVTRRTGADWIRSTRRFALVAWTFLAAGLLLGSFWGYTELGWGGYWGWDPVENAALMPWLTGTAFLHSIIVQEKRGMLRRWNVSLIVATFVLALTGTLLVRSGILDSIHAFGESTLGKYFLALIAVVVAGSMALVTSRADHLRSEARIDSLLSREAFFLLNNVALVGLCFVVFWGTFFPLISEALTGTERSFGPPVFEQLATPLGLVLALLAGVGPALTWRRVTPRGLRRTFLAPGAVTATTLVALLLLTPAAESGTSLVMFCLVAFVLAVVAQEFWRGARARRTISGDPWPLAFAGLVARNRRRYGGYIVHVGIALLFLGTAASSAFKEQADASLLPGETATVGDYTVTYREPTAELLGDSAGTGAPITFGAVLDVRSGDETFTLQPLRNFYPAQDGSAGPIGRFFEGEATSEVALSWGLDRDVWSAVQPDLLALERPIRVANRRFAGSSGDVQALAIGGIVERYRNVPVAANFRLIVFPMVSWVFVGGAIALLGGLVALWPSADARQRRLRGLYAARLGRELAEAQRS